MFLPVSMMSGNSGRLFTEFAWTIIGAILLASSALSLTPMLCSQILKHVKEGEEHSTNFVTAWVNRKLDGVSESYANVS